MGVAPGVVMVKLGLVVSRMYCSGVLAGRKQCTSRASFQAGTVSVAALPVMMDRAMSMWLYACAGLVGRLKRMQSIIEGMTITDNRPP